MLILLGCVVSPLSADERCSEACTFVLSKDGDTPFVVVNPERAATPMTPFSTFKIPNTLIALESGVVQAEEQQLTFDQKRYPVKSWWPKVWYSAPMSLRDAFQVSAVPIYQEIATRIGERKMQQALRDFQYGNRDISSGLDTFWLNGSLKISALEQVSFLHRLFAGELPLSAQTLADFREIMVVEDTDEYTLFAKTGGGNLAKGQALGWYVGVVEREDHNYYFALNLFGGSFKQVQSRRITIARRLLSAHGVLPMAAQSVN